MITNRPWLVIDIETCPMPDCELYLTDPIEAPANYKDPAKIAQYCDDKRRKQIMDAALDLDLCEVVAIGVNTDDGEAPTIMTRQHHDEQFMLMWFWRLFHHDAIGFNVLHFDLPILLRRSLYLGISTPLLSIDKYKHDGIIDLADVLSYGGRMKWRSLSFYAKRFGISHDDRVKGEAVPELVANGQWNDVVAHVLADVTTTTALAQRLGLIYQPSLTEVM